MRSLLLRPRVVLGCLRGSAEQDVERLSDVGVAVVSRALR
jgi:hypothetical protein